MDLPVAKQDKSLFFCSHYKVHKEIYLSAQYLPAIDCTVFNIDINYDTE